MGKYVHGYSSRESSRLRDQAGTLTGLLHGGTVYPARSRVLEAGCGVGAQTLILAKNSPKARFTSVEISPESLARAKAAAARARLSNVAFLQGDIFALPFEAESFDHVFVCFVLEHLAEPLRALRALRKVLRKGGTLTVIEGDHGSAYFHPYSAAAQETIRCLVELQQRMKGNSLIGRELYPLLRKAGFADVQVSPRVVYADASRPEWVEGFTRKTFIAMVEGVKDAAIDAGMMTPAAWKRGITDLRKSALKDGSFSYTFFKAIAVK